MKSDYLSIKKMLFLGKLSKLKSGEIWETVKNGHAPPPPSGVGTFLKWVDNPPPQKKNQFGTFLKLDFFKGITLIKYKMKMSHYFTVSDTL